MDFADGVAVEPNELAPTDHARLTFSGPTTRPNLPLAELLSELGVAEVPSASARHVQFVDARTRLAIGSIHTVGEADSLKATCENKAHRREKGNCVCWIDRLGCNRDRCFHDLVEWLAIGQHQEERSHRETARELKVRYGIRPKD